jgi:hypothetical protein
MNDEITSSLLLGLSKIFEISSRGFKKQNKKRHNDKNKKWSSPLLLLLLCVAAVGMINDE